MMKSVKTILFATNLSQECMAAFDLAAAIAIRFQATIVLLHVMEKMPDYIESRLKGILGEEEWKKNIESQVSGARQQLIGKKSSNKMIQAALSQFCSEAGIDDNACGYHSREIVVTDGEVVQDILECSRSYQCDLIIMGASSGFLSNNTIGPVIKGVMRKSKIPVMMVPPVDAPNNS